MERIYFTVTGCSYCYGTGFLEKNDEVLLVKEPDNERDREAVEVRLPGLGKIGYVANSPYTVLVDSYSAGRLYDKIGDEGRGKIMYIIDERSVLCELLR